MLELSSRRTATPRASVAVGSQQTRRLLLALVLLLAALAAVLVKDRDFWFGGGSATIETHTPETSAPIQTPVNPATQPNQTVQEHPSKKRTIPAVLVQGTPEKAPAVTTKLTIPPLNVEVVAGSKHSTLRPGNNATKLEIATPATKSAPQIEAATNAAQHEALGAAANRPSYPPLAEHMNVQGSVVLQALIGADGTIENLRVMSGPAILAPAAQQAVREWHFKPIIQNGQAVESKATITVNFTIKVADNSANATIAESRPEQILVLTR